MRGNDHVLLEPEGAAQQETLAVSALMQDVYGWETSHFMSTDLVYCWVMLYKTNLFHPQQDIRKDYFEQGLLFKLDVLSIIQWVGVNTMLLLVQTCDISLISSRWCFFLLHDGSTLSSMHCTQTNCLWGGLTRLWPKVNVLFLQSFTFGSPVTSLVVCLPRVSRPRLLFSYFFVNYWEAWIFKVYPLPQ